MYEGILLTIFNSILAQFCSILRFQKFENPYFAFNSNETHLIQWPNDKCLFGQSYKASIIVNYDSEVVIYLVQLQNRRNLRL